MTNDDILPMIKNAAATYNLIGKYSVSFSGAGDSFGDFDNSTASCIHCGVEADEFSCGIYGGKHSTPISHTPECPCSKMAVLAADFKQQAIDVIANTEVNKVGIANRNRWVTKSELLFMIIDFDGRADFNNDGASGTVVIDFKSLTIEIEISVNEMVSHDLGANSYDSSSFDSEANVPKSDDVPKVDIDALGDFKDWLGPTT